MGTGSPLPNIANGIDEGHIDKLKEAYALFDFTVGGGCRNNRHIRLAGQPTIHAVLAVGFGGWSLFDQLLSAVAYACLYARGRGLRAVVGHGYRADCNDWLFGVWPNAGFACCFGYGHDFGRYFGDTFVFKSHAALIYARPAIGEFHDPYC
jgi:hypothetical protein